MKFEKKLTVEDISLSSNSYLVVFDNLYGKSLLLVFQSVLMLSLMFCFHSVQTLTCQKLLATVVRQKHTCACLVQLVSQFSCYNLFFLVLIDIHISMHTVEIISSIKLSDVLFEKINYLMYCICFSTHAGLLHILSEC
jgi:hypothetical protein